MLNQIKEIIKNKNPKGFRNLFKHNQDLVDWIDEQTSHYNPKTFSEKLYILVKEQPTKNECGKYPKFDSYNKGYRPFCGRTGVCECARKQVAEKVSKSKQSYSKSKKQAILDKTKNTNFAKYGVSNTGQTASAKKKHNEFYSSADKVDAITNQIKETKLANHGNENYNNIDKIKKTFRDKSDLYWIRRFPDKDIKALKNKEHMQKLLKNNTAPEIADILKVHVQTVYRYLNKHNIREPFKSIPEKEIVTWLQSIGISNIVCNTRKLIPSKKEIDIYLPDYNLAIEYNGVYWHHEDIDHITKTYHYDKFKQCEGLDIQLITIFSNFWNSKKNIVKKTILAKLGKLRQKIYARKTTVKIIQSKESKAFLNNYHIQGYTPAQITYALYYNDKIIAVMSFSNRRIAIGNKTNDYELVRYASNVRVIGGASKLLKAFKNDHPLIDIFSYSNNEWSDGNLYKALGFELVTEIKPSYWYIHPKEEKLMHRFNFSKQKLIDKGNDPNLTEAEICKQLGLLKIWDCGKRKWHLKANIKPTPKNKMSMINHLNSILKGKNTKSYHILLKNHPDIRNWLDRKTNKYHPMNISEQIYIVLNEPPSKNECGKYPKFNTFNLGYKQFCGSGNTCECSRKNLSEISSKRMANMTPEQKQSRNEKSKATCLERYGVENAMQSKVIQDKIKETNMERYGVEYALKAKEIQDKTKATCMKNHGVEYPLQSKQIQQKSHDTSIKRYGKDYMRIARQSFRNDNDGKNPFQLESVKEKSKETRIKKYNAPHYHQRTYNQKAIDIVNSREKFIKFITNKTATEAAMLLDVCTTTIHKWTKRYNCPNILLHGLSKSKLELTITTLLDEYNINYTCGDRKILAGKELDFILTDYNVAIEVGSIFWHSENKTGRSENYHKNKWDICQENEIDLYTWFDDDINNKWYIIKNKILKITGNLKIDNREIIVSKSTDEKRTFLSENHILGAYNENSYTYLATINDDIVGVISFINRNNYVELTRYATKLGSLYPGLFNQMLSFAKTEIDFTDVIAYTDNRTDNALLFKENGFICDEILDPDFHYTKNYHLKLNRKDFTRNKLLEMADFDITDMSEWDVMQQLGYDRIWDCGKRKWSIKM